MDKPCISVVVPAYKVENYLDRCMESLVAQTWPALEILLVDDGSPDDTGTLCDRWAMRDSRIRVIHKENGGVSSARNRGIAEASGEYLMFVDGDDWVEPEMCEKSLCAMLDHGADVVMWSYLREYPNRSAPKEIFDSDRVFEGEAVQRELRRRLIGLCGAELAHPENADCLSPVWGKLYKTAMVKDISFIDLKTIGTNEDGIFNIEAFARVKKAVFLNQYWYHYRKDNVAAITHHFKPEMLDQWIEMFNAIKNASRSGNWIESFDEALEHRICVSLISQSLFIRSADDGICTKLGFLRRILHMELYKNAFQHLKLRDFPLHWKVFFFCCKARMSIGVYLLAECIASLKKSIG